MADSSLTVPLLLPPRWRVQKAGSHPPGSVTFIMPGTIGSCMRIMAEFMFPSLIIQIYGHGTSEAGVGVDGPQIHPHLFP